MIRTVRGHDATATGVGATPQLADGAGTESAVAKQHQQATRAEFVRTSLDGSTKRGRHKVQRVILCVKVSNPSDRLMSPAEQFEACARILSDRGTVLSVDPLRR